MTTPDSGADLGVRGVTMACEEMERRLRVSLDIRKNFKFCGLLLLGWVSIAVSTQYFKYFSFLLSVDT